MIQPTKYKVIIADDEPEARQGLEILVRDDPSINVCAICRNGIEAIDAIMDHHPDLVFLDIQMPGVDGFEVINSIPKAIMPVIIFVTAYDDYAIRAFEVKALDYLLKPFTDARFSEALLRAKKIIEIHSMEKRINALSQMASQYIDEHRSTDQVIITMSGQNLSKQERLIFKSNGRVYFLPYVEVSRIEAFDYYLKVFVGEHFHLVRDSMKKMEEALPAEHFVRIHKSHIVNIGQVLNIFPLGNNEFQLELRSGIQIKSGRSYKANVQALFGRV